MTNTIDQPTRGLDSGYWRRRLTDLAERHRVPGATLGITGGDGHFDAAIDVAHGVLSKATGVEVTPDSLFQIGSITKVWTATLVMQLVDEGLLDLDRPVADVLPEFAVADADVTKQVTMRHLLAHTSGIDGDIFTDTGRGDDCLERYVAALPDVAQNHPIGATWSYCNAGFVVAGRVVERVTGTTWDAALAERLVAPLGLTRTVTLPEQALLHRTAVGHVAPEGEAPQPAATWGIHRALGPAGLITASVRDLLEFARMHLRGGVAADGSRVLSPDSVAAMQRWEADLPDRYTLGDSWGLGWIRFDWDGHRLIGHDGNTIGQSAFLRVLPDRRLAVALLTNGGNTADLFHDLYAEVFADLAGVTVPPPLRPPADPPPIEVARYVGRYERAGLISEVFERDGDLMLRSTVTGPVAAMTPEPVKERQLLPVEPDLFAMRPEGTESYVAVTFYELADGTPYVHYGARANPRVSATEVVE